jgi:uncharacterized protein with NRDE domain
MRSIFMNNRSGKRSIGERVVTEEKAAPAPPAPIPGQQIEREAPANEVYLDSDIEHGRSRIIIMLSEDGTIIEPVLRIKLSEAQYVSILAQQAEIVAQETILQAVRFQQEANNLRSEVEFLQEQIRKSVQPPTALVPRPFDIRDAASLGED